MSTPSGLPEIDAWRTLSQMTDPILQKTSTTGQQRPQRRKESTNKIKVI